MLTPVTHPPRSILSTLQSLQSWTLPLAIAPITLIHSSLSTLLSASIPLFLRSNFGVDPLLTPNLYSLGTFLGQVLELIVKLPIETVLRRGQIEVAQKSATGQEVETIVDIGPYKGLLGTMYSIVKEEGERNDCKRLMKGPGGGPALKIARSSIRRQRKKGQGFEGLWRGWRVGMWGLIGVWGAAAVGGVGGKGGEF